MSIALWNEIQKAHARIAELEKALADRATHAVHAIEYATKDDLDTFLTRFRAIETKLEAIGRKVKV